ncbi:hypothetical protein [Sorangium sp. So ce854]|uniref:hypothetical protein n=1 Tax=Sorangium sp. So ce854 TaxID=3133322 RepID=UPI003F5F248D
MKAANIISIASMAIGITVAGSTLADNQFIAGTACQVQHNSGGSAEYHGDGIVANGGNSTLYLVCPIDRGAFGSAGSMAVRVFAHDWNASDDVCCTAWHRNAGSNSFSASGASCTSSTNTYQSIDLTIPSHVGSWDFAHVNCTVPGVSSVGAKSAVTGYRGIEQ